MDRLSRAIGFFLILSGIIFNEWLIKFVSSGEIKIAEAEKRIFLLAFQVAAIILGILFLRYKRVVLQNVTLAFCSIFFAFGILELGLRFIPPNLEHDAPLWISYEHKLLNYRINEAHHARSKYNRFGFNDRDHSLRREAGTTRIAVLGDSFIWGVGVAPETIWTNKLARLFAQTGYKVEILNWGKPGWSTLDQFNFLKADGINYEFDLLLIGFVVNDPVVDGSNIKRFIYTGGLIDRLIIQPISRYLFPHALSLCVDLINAFFDTFFGYGYVNWLNVVYAEDNLKKYQQLLMEMSEYCRKHHIRLLVVMTPENHHRWLQERFAQVIPLLKKADMEYLDLYPAVYEELHHIPNRKLWANPGDGHPGDLVTDLYAKHVHRYLLEKGYVRPAGRSSK